jgi:hypothetical protein
MLVACGYRQSAEDEDNWAMVKPDAEHPVLIVPKDGEVVSITVMMSILDKLKMDNATYFRLIAQVQGGAPPTATDAVPIPPA